MAFVTCAATCRTPPRSSRISGYSEAQPISIINFPEQTTGYVLSYNDGNLVAINYSKEAAAGTVANFGARGCLGGRLAPRPRLRGRRASRRPTGVLHRRSHLLPEPSQRQ